MFGELFRFPVSERNVREVLFGFPGPLVLLAGTRIVFPVDQVLSHPAKAAFPNHVTDTVIFFFVDFAVGMWRGCRYRC